MKSWIFIGILIALLSGAAYYYYSSTQSAIETLIFENSILVLEKQTLADANSRNVNTIKELKSSYETAYEDFYELQQQFRDIRDQNNQLRDRLGRHDLSALAEAKPELVQRTINAASRNAMRCFELLAGANLTERELNATNSRDFNSECPFLFDSVDHSSRRLRLE
jgi:regulator of replication initiation timing